MTETILAFNPNRQPLRIIGTEIEEKYRLDENVRVNLQVPKFKYPRNILPAKFAKELANSMPKIAGIVAGMPIQLAYKVIETSLEAAVTKLKANKVI